MESPRYLVNISQVSQLSPADGARLAPVEEKFVFRSNTYYQSLIDWSDPSDPIRQIIMPVEGELVEWGQLDASNEFKYTVAPGLEHKYVNTALLLVNDICGGYCRFCFRKRLFMPENEEATRDVGPGLAYISAHPEISNVLLTGGDPLILSTRRLRTILQALRTIDHVRIIRIGSKMPAFNPARILNDQELPALFEEYRTGKPKIYLMAHFNHARELTPEASRSIDRLQRAGVVTVNQTPLIRGVNDSAMALAELFDRLSFLGVTPYYVFQCRPTLGNQPYSLPLESAYTIFLEAQNRCSGLAKRSRFVMSHETGKVEVAGLDEEHIYLRYHQAADPSNASTFLVFKRNPAAYWLEDYIEAGTPRGAVAHNTAGQNICCSM